jgi:lipopolysaccharide transport system permease protein
VLPTRFAARLWCHRNLVKRLALRRIEDIYRGSVLGPLWALLNPALLLLAYSFVFEYVLHARRPASFQGADSLPFALFLFPGLLPFWFFAECVGQAPHLMRVNRVLIRQVLFPIEVLPGVTLFVALFRLLLGFIIFAAAFVILGGHPSVTWLAAPLALIPVALWSLGAIWIFSSIGVYFEDLGQIVGLVITLALFLSPVFYPLDQVPETYVAIYSLNPLAIPIEGFRSMLLGKALPGWPVWIAAVLGGWIWAELAFAWFERSKGGFADVL